MKSIFLLALLCISISYSVFAADKSGFPDLSKISSKAELNNVIATVNDEATKKALSENAASIVATAKRHPHVLAVIEIIESSPGMYKKVNTTPEALKKAVGAEIAIFDTLIEVSTKILKGKAHVYRDSKNDPYDAAFMEHLGHIQTLETVKIVATGIEDSWMAPLLKLTNLKYLYIEGRGRLGDASLVQLQHLSKFPQLINFELAYFGKATDAGLELLAGFKNLERFTFRGSKIKGHGFAKFEGWTKLKYINFHSNHLDDEGFANVCGKFPNLEFIKLWHSQAITDASAESLKKLTKLKGIEISSSKGSAALLKNLNQLPLDYAAISYGVNTPAADMIATVKSIPTMRRFAFEQPKLSSADLKNIASMGELEELSLERLPLTDENIALLKGFSYLKKLKLVERRKKHWYKEVTKEKVLTALPKVSVSFIK
ncbi:MAG: hypothetical protein NE328_16995 [Lentisphaeraceae bacterium]|nr:hypothetical protein [Lentisphaeraceae bacterium]